MSGFLCPNVVRKNVIMLNVVQQKVIMLNVVMLNVANDLFILSVVTLIVVALFIQYCDMFLTAVKMHLLLSFALSLCQKYDCPFVKITNIFSCNGVNKNQFERIAVLVIENLRKLLPPPPTGKPGPRFTTLYFLCN
jgi:hypothetical protein